MAALAYVSASNAQNLMKFRLQSRITKENAHNNFEILFLLEVLEKQHVCTNPFSATEAGDFQL